MVTKLLSVKGHKRDIGVVNQPGFYAISNQKSIGGDFYEGTVESFSHYRWKLNEPKILFHKCSDDTYAEIVTDSPIVECHKCLEVAPKATQMIAILRRVL